MIVLFLSNCDKTDRCEEILSDLEEIDEQLEDMGILFVYTDDESYAAKLKINVFPTIAYFRNGDRLMYEGSIENEMAVLRFATDLHNIRIPGKIAEVGVSLLEFFMDERKDVFAFMYEEDDGRAKKILQRLEAIDDNLVRTNRPNFCFRCNFSYYLIPWRRDSNPLQKSCTRLRPLKDALLTELQRCDLGPGSLVL